MNDTKRLNWLEDNPLEAIRLFQNLFQNDFKNTIRDAIDEEMNNKTEFQSKTVIKSVKKKKPFNIFKTLF